MTNCFDRLENTIYKLENKIHIEHRPEIVRNYNVVLYKEALLIASWSLDLLRVSVPGMFKVPVKACVFSP